MTDPQLPARFDAQVLRSAFAAFPSGVTAVCAERSGRDVGERVRVTHSRGSRQVDVGDWP